MKLPLLIIFLIISNLSIFGQNEIVKIDTVYNSNDIAHRIINYKAKSKSNYYDLAIKCKEKADSLLMEYFELNFFNNKIFLDAESSNWYTNDYRTTQIFENKKEKPKKVELIYSILNKNSAYFNLIKITLECENEIKIIHSNGIPNKKNYKVNIEYQKAVEIANNNGFFDNENLDEYERYSYDMDVLSLEFNDDIYQWEIHKEIKKELSKQVGSCSTIKTYSKALFINAETGKIEIKDVENNSGSVHWY